mgnify:CR=1 FL=1
MSYIEKLHKIKALVFDVDGVMTNGQVVLLPDGQQMRQMHSKDGYALQLAIKKGFIVAIITGGSNQAVKERMRGVGITDIYLGASHKDEAMQDLMDTYGLEASEVMYMGDDVPDLGALKLVDLRACPADASDEVKSYCNFVSKKQGGQGCVRDIIEQVMKSQKKWFTQENLDNLAEFTW